MTSRDGDVSKFRVEKLIKLVRANPVIYDVNHPDYRRISKRKEIWRALGRQLSVTPSFLKRKWQRIRYKYMRDCKKSKINNNQLNLTFLTNALLAKYNSNVNANTAGSLPNVENSSSSRAHSSNATDIDRFDVHDDGDGEVSMQGIVSCLAPTNGNSCNLTNLTNAKPVEPECCKDPTRRLAPGSSSSYTSPELGLSESLGDRVPLQIIKIEAASNEVLPSSTASPFNGMVQLNDKSIEIVESEIIKEDSPDLEIISTSLSKKTTNQAPQTNSMPTNDSIELYCLSLVDTFRAMSRLERERVKCEFARILKDAKYTDE